MQLLNADHYYEADTYTPSDPVATTATHRLASGRYLIAGVIHATGQSCQFTVERGEEVATRARIAVWIQRELANPRIRRPNGRGGW